ncbi:MAG TPA: M2 family metallopeptidase, partial [Geopsychrobacteraceae bacterium]
MRNSYKAFPVIFAAGILFSCESGDQAFPGKVKAYLHNYNQQYQGLLKEAAEAEWRLNTYIVEGDTVTKRKVERANEKMAAFTGSEANIEKSRWFLTQHKKLSDLQIRQLEYILYRAGKNPAIAGELVKERIKADAAQTAALFGFDFRMDGKSVTPNEIDKILRESDDENERVKAWEASKEVGRTLKEGLVNLRDLRNQCVQALDFDDYFAYEVSE